LTSNKLVDNVKKGPFHLFSKFYHEGDRLLFSKLYLDRDKRSGNTVLVAGSGRSGTTWLAQILNFRKEFRMIFEPFHNQKVEQWRSFPRRLYLSGREESEEVHRLVEAVLRGDIRNRWADSYNTKFFCRKRIVKDIRINLMLDYIHTNFPRLPIIFLMRHPCAVALSRMRLGWDRWDTDLGDFLGQENLMEDHLAGFREILAGCEDGFEREICFWAVENFLPVKQLSREKILFLSYEQLATEPKRELERVFCYLNRDYDERVWNAVDRNSRTTWRKGPVPSGAERVAAWEGLLEDGQKRRAVEILEAFGLSRIYAEDPMPKPGFF